MAANPPATVPTTDPPVDPSANPAPTANAPIKKDKSKGRFNPNDFKSVKLKKTKKSKAQIQKEKTKFHKQLCENADDYYKLVKETYFENYYDKIKDLTFATDYIELTKNDCQLLIKLHKEYLKWEKQQSASAPASDDQKTNNNIVNAANNNASNASNNQNDIDDNKANDPNTNNAANATSDITNQIPTIQQYNYNRADVQSLIDKINNIIQQKNWQHIFIRMSIRSPKDAALTSVKFTEILAREYKSLRKTQGVTAPSDATVIGGDADEIWNINQKVIACYRAQTFALACTTGTEAIDLLVRSPRIQGDMKSFIDGTYKQKFQLVIRNFKYFDVSFEFRSFIYKKKMTGLTQYNDLCYFDDLVKFKDNIVNKIKVFIEDECIKTNRITLESFVLDIVMVDVDYDGNSVWPALTLDRLNKLKVMIIEINPLAEFAGGGLFEWNKDKDVLLGDKPFEFRIQKKLSSYITADLMPEWHPFIFGNKKKLIK